MKYLLILLVMCFVLAMIATNPLFVFAWFMAQRVFTACVVCFVVGYMIGRWS